VPLEAAGRAFLTASIRQPYYQKHLLIKRSLARSVRAGWQFYRRETQPARLSPLPSPAAYLQRAQPCRLLGSASGRAGQGRGPSRPTLPIISGVAIATSKSVQPPWILRWFHHRRPRHLRRPGAPAGAFALANTSTRTVYQGHGAERPHRAPAGRHGAGPHPGGYGFYRGIERCSRSLFGQANGLSWVGNSGRDRFSPLQPDISYRVLPLILLRGPTDGDHHPPTGYLLQFQAHVAGSTFDLAHRAFEVDGVQIFHLHFGDLPDLLASYAADLFPGEPRTLWVPGCLFSSTEAGGVFKINVNEPSV
jgi:hypothetical protein